MGGIGLSCLQPQPNTTYIRTHIQDNKIRTYTHTPAHIYMHRDNNKTIRTQSAHTQTNTTICSTQSAHNLHTIFTQSAHTQKQKQRYMQHIQENTEQHTEQNTENSTEQPQQNSAHNYRTYSFDLYHEYVCIKNSNTIELYTISKENI